MPVNIVIPGIGAGAGLTILDGLVANDIVYNPTPSSPTDVTGLSVTVPASGVPRIAVCSVWLYGGPLHLRLFLLLDGAQEAQTPGAGNDSDGRSSIALPGYPLAIPGDSTTHIIKVQIAAQQTTNASTLSAGSSLSVICG